MKRSNCLNYKLVILSNYYNQSLFSNFVTHYFPVLPKYNMYLTTQKNSFLLVRNSNVVFRGIITIFRTFHIMQRLAKDILYSLIVVLPINQMPSNYYSTFMFQFNIKFRQIIVLCIHKSKYPILFILSPIIKQKGYNIHYIIILIINIRQNIRFQFNL